MMQTTMINPEVQTMNVSNTAKIARPVTNMKDITEYCNYIEKYETKNQKHYDIFKAVLDAFEDKFFLQDTYGTDEIKIKYKIPETISTNYVSDLCNKKLNEHIKTEKYKDTELDYRFYCAYNILIDILKKNIDTLIKICVLRDENKDHEDFRHELLKNTALLEEFIFSVNCRGKFYGKLTDYSFLHHNFESIKVEKYNGEYTMCILYKFHDYGKIEIEKESMKILKEKLPLYYKEKNMVNKAEIFEYENAKKFKEYLESNNTKCDDNLNFAIEMVFSAIATKRCLHTKVKFFFEDNYYNKDEKLDCKNNSAIMRAQNLENFLSEVNTANVTPIKFDILCMYKNYNIISTYMLSIEQEKNIDLLAFFSDRYITIMLFCIQEKHKTVVTEFFDNLIQKNEQTKDAAKILELKEAKQICTNMINPFKWPIEITTEMDATTKIDKYHTYDFLKHYDDDYKLLYEQIEKYILHVDVEISEKVDQMPINTQILLKNHIGKVKFFENIFNIIKLKDEIKINKAKIVDGKVKSFADLTNRTYLMDFAHVKNELEKMMQAQNEHTAEAASTTIKVTSLKVKMHKQVSETYDFSQVSENGKTIITGIINVIIQLNHMIIKAERDAATLIREIEFYSGIKEKKYENEFWVQQRQEFVIDGETKEIDFIERVFKRQKINHEFETDYELSFLVSLITNILREANYRE